MQFVDVAILLFVNANECALSVAFAHPRRNKKQTLLREGQEERDAVWITLNHATENQCVGVRETQLNPYLY